jgi:hypothetical protein
MNGSLRRLATLGVALGLCGAAVPAAAQEPDATETSRLAAQDAHRHALELFDRGRHAEALAEFKRAYGLSPSFRILFNIGLSQAALGDSLAAVEAFSSYLREGAEHIPGDRRQQVEAEITRLSKLLGWLNIDVAEAGAEVTLDGALLGQGPVSRQLRLNTGRHTVGVRSSDGTLKTQSVTLAAGEEQRLRFQTQISTPPTGSPRANGPAPSSAEAAPNSRHDVPWVAWGVTGALGASAAVTGVLALSAHSAEKATKARRGVTQEELQAARDKVENRALATDILLAGTALAAGVSVYLTFRTGSSQEAQTSLCLAPGSVTLLRTF